MIEIKIAFNEIGYKEDDWNKDCIQWNLHFVFTKYFIIFLIYRIQLFIQAIV